MSRRAINWIIIIGALALACANPAYRHYGKEQQPIVTLGLDLKGGVEVLLQAVPDVDEVTNTRPTVTDDQMAGAEEVVRNRVDPAGTKEVYITRVGLDRLLLQVPGEKNPDGIIKVLGDTALLEFLNTGDESIPDGTDLNEEGTAQRKEQYAKYETILTGADLQRAYTGFNANKPVIHFEFKAAAADTFGEFTNNHQGQYLTVALDGKVLTSPVIKSAIWGGSGIIEGQFDMEEADRVVRQLNAGALPVPLQILSSSVVGPSLGQKSIDNSFKAGVIGFLIVLIFMVIFYRLPGFVANIALAMYVVLVLGFLSLINATLTLPGIAGFLLSVGMAIDANIIIFERLKEEIRWGKTLIAALDAAFARAWVAILDGHVTVILGSMVLFFYGTGPVKGFAVALFLGSIFALYSGVFVTRNLLELFVRQFKNVHLYAPHTGELEIPAERLRNRHYIHFVEKTGIWLAISFIWLAVGIGFMFQNNTKYGHPFNLGIDFTGGDSIILRFKDELPREGSAFTKIVEKYSEGEPTVQVDAVDPHLVSIRMRFSHSETEAGAAKSAEAFVELKKELGDAFGGYQPEGDAANPTVLEYNHIGPTVGAELISNALWALFWGLVLIFLYVLVRFNAWQFSLAAVLNIVQDMMLLMAATAILGLEINSSFIAVVLTIAGYSINDTIIIFDRIRENKRHFPPSTDQAQLCNLSLTQTLGRSIYTVLTVIFMTVTLLVFGGAALHDFMLAMLAGLILGGFSSIRFATPLYLFLNKISGAGSGTVTLATAGGPSLDAATISKSDDVVKKVVEREVERRKEKSQAKQQRRR